MATYFTREIYSEMDNNLSHNLVLLRNIRCNAGPIEVLLIVEPKISLKLSNSETKGCAGRKTVALRIVGDKLTIFIGFAVAVVIHIIVTHKDRYGV